MAKKRQKSNKKTLSLTQGSLALKQELERSQLEDALGRIQDLESDIGRVLRHMHEKVQQFEYLYQFSRLLNSTLDPTVVREKALEATCMLLGCETASLLLVDPKTAELYWDTALGNPGLKLKESLRLPINDQSIAGWVAMNNESVIINDVEKDPRYFKRAKGKSNFKTNNMICVPLVNKERVVGVLQAINKLESPNRPKAKREWPEFYESDQKLLETLAHQVAIAIENAKLYSSLKKNFYDTVEALVEAIEKKDHYTGGHTKRVVHYSMSIAKYMNLTKEELERIRLGAILHDVGKIGIEDKILKKDSPLDPDEWKVMKRHPQLGYEIMMRVEGLRDVIGGMRFHHERFDGKGYPLGLKGEEIPLLARIIAVADTYDAMVSTRPYRKGLPTQKAYDEIVRYSGTQFDPTVVEAFKKAYTQEKMGKKSGAIKATLSNCD